MQIRMLRHFVAANKGHKPNPKRIKPPTQLSGISPKTRVQLLIQCIHKIYLFVFNKFQFILFSSIHYNITGGPEA